MAITRLSGGNTPPDGSDPRTFPAIWNDAVDDIEALELPITAGRIADGAVTAPKLANTAGAVMVFDDATARTTAIPTPVEGMVTYLSDEDEVQVFDGSAFKAVGPGKILQVVSTAKTDTFSTSSGTFTTITGMTATITPSSTASKILVMAQTACGSSLTCTYALRLNGGNAGTYIADASSSRIRAVDRWASGTGLPLSGQMMARTLNFLDAPNTVSAVTYGVEVLVLGATGTMYVNRSDDDADGSPRGASSIILIEVAG